MKFQDLKQGDIYENITDLAIPLMYTGEFEDVSQEVRIVRAFFNPIKTKQNKNWFNTKPIYVFNFYGENLENTTLK